MTDTRKIELLYQKAHGQKMDASPAEQRELSKYKVSVDDGNYATKNNIRAYVKAVDSGSCRLPFYDWCYNNHRGDRRRKGHSEKAMADTNKEKTLAAMFTGWLFWGVAIYWLAGQTLSVGVCAIAGAITAAILLRMNRKLAGFTLILLPAIILAVIASI